MLNQSSLEAAATALRVGGLVGFPTDTVYGLACLATDGMARARFYAVKARPEAQPAILMVAGVEAARPWAVLDQRATELAGEYWPGALTLVLPATPQAAALLGQLVHGGTIAVRVPAHPVALALLEAVGEPLCTSSANRSGEPAPLSASEVRAGLGGAVDVVLAGEAGSAQPSSILDMTGPEPRILRQGAIPTARLLR